MPRFKPNLPTHSIFHTFTYVGPTDSAAFKACIAGHLNDDDDQFATVKRLECLETYYERVSAGFLTNGAQMATSKVALIDYDESKEVRQSMAVCIALPTTCLERRPYAFPPPPPLPPCSAALYHHVQDEGLQPLRLLNRLLLGAASGLAPTHRRLMPPKAFGG